MSKAIICIVAIAMILGISLPIASAQNLPEAYYGTVTIDGVDAPVGTVITAVHDGEECGSITTVYPGKFGSDDEGNFGALSPKLIVRDLGTDETVEFLVNGVSTGQTTPFQSGEVTRIDLTVGDALPLPHLFYGTVLIGGTDAPAGTIITAKIDSVQYGSITAVYAGKYGSDDKGNFGIFIPKLSVQGYIDDGSTIEFYVNGVQAGETASFISGEVTELNLTAENTPTPTPTATPMATPEPFFLNVTSPEDQSAVYNSEIEVEGETLLTAIVSVNGVMVAVEADGTFSTTVILMEGINNIEIIASNLEGTEEISEILVVAYIPPPTPTPTPTPDPGDYAPYAPSNPTPSNGATGVSVDAVLSWNGGDPNGDDVEYRVYFGTTSSPRSARYYRDDTSYTPSYLQYNTHYYWKIVARDSDYETTEGPLWEFTTEAQITPTPTPTPYTITGLTNEVDCSTLPSTSIQLYDGAILEASTSSDDLGEYSLAVPGPGSYDVIAIKSGYKSVTQSIAITNPGEYTKDFSSETGLVPEAPDMSYVLLCVNHWQYPVTPCDLSMSKVLQVVNAWLNPILSIP